MKKIAVFLIIIINFLCFSDEIYLNKDIPSFKFKYNNTIVSLSSEENIFYHLFIDVKNINSYETDSRIGNIQDLLNNKKNMIDSGEYLPNIYDKNSRYFLFFKIIKNNKTNALTSIFINNTDNWFDEIYCNEIICRYEFFVDKEYISITLKTQLSFFNNNSNKLFFEKYFKKYKDGFGFVLQSEEQGKNLINKIVNKDSSVPEGLSIFYSEYLKIINSLELL